MFSAGRLVKLFIVSLFILLLNENINGHVLHLHEPNTFETYQNLKIFYAMKVI